MQEYPTTEELKNILVFLSESLPNPPTLYNGPFLLSDKTAKTLNGYLNEKDQLQQLADCFMRHLALPTPTPLLLRDSEYSPGLNVSVDTERAVILITKNPYFKLKHYAGILAHECIHSFLNRRNVKDPDPHNNEILTDVAAAFLGLGHFLLEAYRPIEWSTTSNSMRHKHSLKLGYVAPESIRKAIILTARFRKWNLQECRSSLRRMDDKVIFSLFNNSLIARLTSRSS